MAFECLGYIWYYGRTGVKDYKKAYENFEKAMKKGNIVAAYGKQEVKKALRSIVWIKYKIKDVEVFDKAYKYIEQYY